MISLIVNGDDFGLCAPVNQGIATAFRQGILTSTSLLANSAGFADACTLMRKLPTLAVGLHVNLTCGQPLSPARTVASLVDQDGKFFSKWGFLQRAFRNALLLSHLKAEIRAQFQAVQDQALTITHVDSHHHVHLLPLVGRAVVELAEEYHVPVWRTFNETETAGCWQTRIMNRFYHRFGCRLYRTTSAPRRFWGTDFMLRRDKKEALLHLIRLLPAGVNELMCHPAAADINSAFPENRIDRLQELRALCDPEVRRAVKAAGIHLVAHGG